MSNFTKLIQQYCPNGVIYKRLGDVATIIRGGNFQKKDYVEQGFPCIHYGQIYTKYNLFVTETISCISNEKAEQQKKAEPGDIIMAVTSENIEDVCKCIAWLGDSKVAVSGHAAIIHHNLNPKFLTYYLSSSLFYKQKLSMVQGTKVIEVSPEKLKKTLLPVPPLEVQQEIVRILDQFTELTNQLTADLAAELSVRKKQYEYYRNKLLNVESNIQLVPLKEIATVSRGIRVVRKQLDSRKGYPVFQNSMTPLGYYKEYNCEEGMAFVIGAGAAGAVGYSSSKFWAADDCYYIQCSTNLNSRYTYHVLLSRQTQLISKVRRASVPRLSRTAIEGIIIPLPPLEEQHRIVSILDYFDALCNNLTSSLPAEIEARRKQYEYYRDKLLDFKKMEA